MIPKHPQFSPYNKPLPYPVYGDVLPGKLDTLVQSVSIGPAELNNSQNKINVRYWVLSQENGNVVIRGSSN